jgi:outer membrane protein assembly factor BamB
MKLLAILLLIPLISPLNYVIEIENNSTYENACRYNINGWIYVHIEGEPYERGYQHGYLLYAEIADMIYRWSNIIHNCPVIVKNLPIDTNSSKYEELSSKWWKECKKLAMKIFWPYYPEEYKEEIKGIADGAKARGVKIYGEPISYEDVLTLNEMYELMSILVNPQKGFHPLKDIFNSLSSIFPSLKGKEIELSSALYPTHHCNGFAAVGNATKDGNIVISDSVWCGGWWYSYYIAQRWNVILDIEPSSGHRLIIATSPGYIWSDEDYWQNDAGIAMVETTFIQGWYKLRGLPLAIRARMAIQYGNSIDDVVYYLLKDNTGVMNAQWLIADAKEKEIALFEFGLYHYNLVRTKNGFLWSANNPFDFRVRRDILGYEVIKAPIFRLAHLLLNATGYQYYTLFYTPSERDIKFEELGKKYYGRIDAEVVKKIMSTPPITDFTTDCKLTDGKMIFNNSLWAFWGNPTYVWNTSDLYKLKGVRDVPPSGWTKIVGVPYDFQPEYEKGNAGKGREARMLWQYEIGEMNYDYADFATDERNIYAYADNMLYAFNENGSLLWKKELDGKINDVEAEGNVYVVTTNASYAFSYDGKKLWQGKGGKDIEVGNGRVYIAADTSMESDVATYFDADFIRYKDKLYLTKDNKLIADEWKFEAEAGLTDVVIDKDIYVGSYDGNVYCLDENGKIKWKYTAGWGISDVDFDSKSIYVGSYDGNVYCLDKEGGIQWIFSCNASVHHIKAYGDLIFATSSDGRFYAVNKSDGTVIYSFAPSYEIEGVYNYITTPVNSNIVAINGKVFFSAAGKIYCLDAETIEKDIASKEKQTTQIVIGSVIAIIAIGGIFAAFVFRRKKEE